jgi:hypothetical protein
VRTRDPKQRWLTFVRNHAKVMAACDFFVVITAGFRTLYLFVVIEIGSRQILHQNVTAHPTAAMTAYLISIQTGIPIFRNPFGRGQSSSSHRL